MKHNKKSAKKHALIIAIIAGTAVVAGAVGTIISNVKRYKAE